MNLPRAHFPITLAAILLSLATGTQAQERFGLEDDGLLILTAAQDSTSGFRWENGPGPSQLSLIWPEGRLTIPADLAMESDPSGDLGVPLQAGFTGTGPGGGVDLRDGRRIIRESLAFTDGRVHWVVSGGRLDIAGPNLRYRRAQEPATGEPEGALGRDQQADFLLIAGLLLLIAVLLRRARSKTRRRN